MTTFAESLKRAEELLNEGRLMSGVEALEEGRRLTTDPNLVALASYNLGATEWARLGNGDAARREFNAVVAVFDEHGRDKISKHLRGMLPNALENAMLCALSFDEFGSLAARVKALTPKSLIVIQLTPETLKARDEGQPWSDRLFAIADSYYSNDPSHDPGRYGEARSTYQLLLAHRRDFRLSRDRWRMATYDLAALSLRMHADCMQTYNGTFSPEEFLPILSDAIPLIDDYLAANTGDDALEDIRRRADGFLVDIRERWARQQASPSNPKIDSRVALLNKKGLALLHRRKFEAALAKFTEAQKLCREIGDQEKLQTCIGNIALVAANTGDPHRALELVSEKEAICRKMNLHRGLANALATRAAILESLHKTKEAVASAKEADQICKHHGFDEIARQLRPLLERLESEHTTPLLLGQTRDDSTGTPSCYVCAEEGHTREMRLIAFGTMINLREWDKPWSPTQGCFQCAECGRLTCYTHSEMSRICACGACSWTEKQYLQQELDNG